MAVRIVSAAACSAIMSRRSREVVHALHKFAGARLASQHVTWQAVLQSKHHSRCDLLRNDFRVGKGVRQQVTCKETARWWVCRTAASAASTGDWVSKVLPIRRQPPRSREGALRHWRGWLASPARGGQCGGDAQDESREQSGAIYGWVREE